MSMRLLVALVVAVAVAPPISAKVKDPAITPSSGESVVVMRANREFFDWGVVFNRAQQTGFGSRLYMLNVHSFEPAPFVTKTMAPGTYQLNRITQQSQWATCLGNNTVSFTVQPGKVYFLGTLNSRDLLADLQQSAVKRGKTRVSNGSFAVGWEPAVKPEFAPATEEDLAELRQFLATHMPKTTAPVEALSTTPSSFNTTKGEKLIQVCG